MAFKFSLEQILQYRNNLEERAQEELARRKLTMEETACKLNALHEKQENTHGVWRKQTEKEIDLVSLNHTYDYMLHLGEEINRGSEEQKQTVARVDEQRTELKKCWQERRIMELLKDKFYVEYREMDEKRENAANDEMTLTSFVRNRRPGNGGLL